MKHLEHTIMTWTTEDDIKKAISSIDDAKSNAADIRHRTRMIMYRFLSELENVIEKRNLSRRELAELVGTSPSYITQLFRGNKVVNLETLAKFETALDFTFKIRIDGNINEWVDDNLDFHTIFSTKYHSKDGFWAFHKKERSDLSSFDLTPIAKKPNIKEDKYLKLVG